jgi:hypothetical protein
MNNVISMSAEFEQQKNLKAAAYSGAIAGALLLLFIFWKWPIPIKHEPPVEEYIEVNLGSGDQGFGSDQPQLPGEPAPAQQVSYSPPQPVRSQEESVRDVSTDENSHDAPTVVKPAVSKPDATKINSESKTVKTNTTVSPPVVTHAPRPKATMGKVTGGNGNGGNGAETYKPGGNEGIAGGNGDQGVVGGNPNGKSYTGAPKNMGIRVINIPPQNYEDDFNESGRVMLDIVVNGDGKLVSATYQPGGSTITNRSQIEIAKRRASQGTYPKYDGGFRQTIQVNFKVKS